MSKQKLTDWFPPNVNPVRTGVYNASIIKDSRSFRFWNGHYWSHAFFDYDSDVIKKLSCETKSNWQHEIEWRGLKNPC